MENNKLKNFKKIVIKAMNLKTEEEIQMFEQIPDTIIEEIFENNFNGNYKLARDIILNNFSQDTYKKIETEKSKINDMTKASTYLSSEIKKGNKVLFLTDTDNDGSLAQANILEFEKALTDDTKKQIDTLYCQQINGNNARGFTVDLVDEWVKNNPEYKTKTFTIISADNGINSVEEQIKINEKYPNAKLIVTDHHLPDEDSVVVENKQTLIVNPKYKPSKYFKEKNISGANVLGTLLEKTLDNLEKAEFGLKNKENVILGMREISRIANLLDYVDTDISDKPLESYKIQKYSSLGGLMNVNNSLNKIITSDLSKDGIKKLFKEEKDLDIDLIADTMQKIKEQNVFAKKLLMLQKRFNAMPEEAKAVIPKDRISQDIIVELNKNIVEKEDINPNYIEQLRPYIYNYAASASVSDYELGIMNKMNEVYLDLKKLERVLQTEFGKNDLLNVEKLDNSTIMYPKDANHLQLLNRKLLGKIYNEENNGFLMILDSVTKEKATGSFRSVYRIQDILKGKEKLESVFGIKISFQGHDKAAGFFIEKTDGTELKATVINEVNKFINKRLDTLKLEDKKSYAHLIQTDFHYPAIALFDKFNQAIKGSLTNMQSISPVIQFNKSTYLTNSKTQEEQNLQQLIKNKRYGYVPIEITFNGNTIIVPTEMLRKVADSNFKDGVQVSFMTDGVFIGNKVIPEVNNQNMLKIKSPKNERKKMIDFFNDNYKDNGYFTELPKEKIQESPFFKFNKFGKSEYNRFQNVVIDVIERSKTDMIVVADTEANGLGNAPKVCNFGVVEMKIDEKSGSIIQKETFENAYFNTLTGQDYLLKKGQIGKLKKVTEEQFKVMSITDKKGILKNVKTNEMFLSDENFNDFKKMNNFKMLNDGKVIVNRELRFDIGSIFIKDLDTKISERITSLTAIDNTLLNKIGITSAEADKVLVDRYKDKKCIFQAHNLPYDLGVIKGNFKEFYNVATDFESGNLLNDSALYSRDDKLAYDPIGIAVFNKDFVPALAQIQFFHSDYSDLSLAHFLSNEEDGKLPDRTDRFVLKKKNGVVTIIDKTENTETLVVPNIELLEREDIYDDSESVISQLSKLHTAVEMPKNAIKYSVQALSDYDIIRSLILSTKSFNLKTIDIPVEFSEHKEKMDNFMLNYHFDASAKENFRNFVSTFNDEEKQTMFVTDGFRESEIERLKKAFEEEQAALPPRNRKRKVPDFSAAVGNDPKLEKFENFINDFLNENKDLQSKFHEVWAYKKVLQLVNPTKKTLKDKDIIEMVSYQTSIPVEKVKVILEDAVDFKDIYKIDSVIQKEPHNNVFMDKCDVVLESVLTFKRPADRSYNSYTHSMTNVVDMYLNNIVRTSGQHIISQQRKMAADSFSRKQALSYKRNVKTDYIKQSQEIEENIKFKFSSETLPIDTFAYAELKKEVTEEQIEDLSAKLEFVVRNEQMKYSMDEKIYLGEDGEELLLGMKRILKCNDEKIEKIKDEMNEYFESVYFTRKESDMKKILKMVIGGYMHDEKMEVPRTMEAINKGEKNLLIELTKKISDISCSLGVNALPPMNNDEVNIAKGNVVGENPEMVVSTNHPVTKFFDKIKEISDEMIVSMNQKFEEKLENASESEKAVLLRNKIVPTVEIKRQKDAVHLLKFKELTGEFMTGISNEKTRRKIFELDMKDELAANNQNIRLAEEKEAAKKARARKPKA